MILKLKNGNTLKISVSVEHRNNENYLMDHIELPYPRVFVGFEKSWCEPILKNLNYNLDDLEDVDENPF